jgi:hypothetical protein
VRVLADMIAGTLEDYIRTPCKERAFRAVKCLTSPLKLQKRNASSTEVLLRHAAMLNENLTR